MNIETLCENIYEDLEGYISNIETTYMGISFVYETDHWDDYDKRVRFKIECEGVAESTLNLDAGGSFQLLSDHPILDEYTGDSGSLFFSSKPENPNEILGLLYSAHESYFCQWRELSKYLNTNISFDELLNSGNGSLATAPIKVLNIYKNAVSDYLKVNIIKSHTNDGGYKLLLIEDTYIVCKKFSVKYC
ncbi:hypothetical protein [Shewanella sp. 10N.286.48.A6]|uniref:hypothetical protein n=1 Tax=Shewanella sp. 10N.286.48.A6 TaxID=1880833 RepID=UPI000C82A403|nr:hypothetical protein [Shewanella sp. 10N.286.48.A6]PMH97231.1 hypothetical protein BCU55_17660 [Shewanella sp. 10N.286.48.A6]